MRFKSFTCDITQDQLENLIIQSGMKTQPIKVFRIDNCAVRATEEEFKAFSEWFSSNNIRPLGTMPDLWQYAGVLRPLQAVFDDWLWRFHEWKENKSLKEEIQ